jgi:carboxymethylenebutenolidase
VTHNIQAESIIFTGHEGSAIEGYLALPTDVESHGSVVVIHHLPGYDESTKEIVRRFASCGYAALMPNLYHRLAPGASADDAAAVARNEGGVSDEQLVGDVQGAMHYLQALATSNGKVASIGFCSGGRQSFLAGCRLPLDAVIDCYGAFVTTDSTPEFPLAVKGLLDEIPGLTGPVLGLFGADDLYPSPEQNNELTVALSAAHKPHEFHTFEGAGHAFFNVDRPSYRPESAVEGWKIIMQFLSKTIGDHHVHLPN